jgi:Fe-S-cluster containining protein
MSPALDKDSLCTDVIVEECTTCKDKACCKKFLVHLSASERLLFKTHDTYSRDGSPTAIAFLAKHENGDCYYLTPTGCSIWSSRPSACREYSCMEEDFLQLSF